MSEQQHLPASYPLATFSWMLPRIRALPFKASNDELAHVTERVCTKRFTLEQTCDQKKGQVRSVPLPQNELETVLK